MNDDYIMIYAIIPKELYQSKDLSDGDKLIAERITALCKKEGHAWVSNDALADMYGIRKNTITKHMRHLKEYGYIRCMYNNPGGRNSKRLIYLSTNIWDNEIAKDNTNSNVDMGQTSTYNSKTNINKKDKINNRIIYNNNITKKEVSGPIITEDPDGVMVWNGKRCEIDPASPEEQKEMEDMLNECIESCESNEQ
jgi:ribosomal protein S25